MRRRRYNPDIYREPDGEIRPLRRLGPGLWRSRNGLWEFARAMEDPHPQRWFAFRINEDGSNTADDQGATWKRATVQHAENEGSGHTTLREVADFALECEEANDGSS